MIQRLCLNSSGSLQIRLLRKADFVPQRFSLNQFADDLRSVLSEGSQDLTNMDIEYSSDSEKAPSTGFTRFGNFNNYYQFHPAEIRIRLLPDYLKLIKTTDDRLICLDVGCNVGELTQALHKHITSKSIDSCHILGVDLDQCLIEQANGTNQNNNISFISVDVLTEHFEQVCQAYLKEHNRTCFDIIYCFSITMWIHINYGDEGLRLFLSKLSAKTTILVIEPQPWKCYTRAVRKMKRSKSEPFTEFNNLKIRRDVESYIDSFLKDELHFVKILQSAPTMWGRQINFYKNIKAARE